MQPNLSGKLVHIVSWEHQVAIKIFFFLFLNSLWAPTLKGECIKGPSLGASKASQVFGTLIGLSYLQHVA